MDCTMTAAGMAELFSQIEAVHGKTWNLWCAYDGKYVIQLTVNKQIEGAGDRVCLGPNPDLMQLLREAAEYRFILRIRRKPDPPPMRSRYTAQKNGTKWHVLFDGACILAGCKTKTEAESYADNSIARRVAERDEWDAIVGPIIAGKTEGVDYKFV